MVLSLSSAAGTTLVKRCFSSTSTLTRRSARLPAGSLSSNSSSSIRLATTPNIIGNNNSKCLTAHCQQYRQPIIPSIRTFSSMPPPPTATNPNDDTATAFQPPTSLSAEAGLGAQDAMKLFIEHGIGKQKLQQIASLKTSENAPLVDRWQKMVATYLETQCHVISLLGYKPDEIGIATYTQQLSEALKLSPPEVQEKLRTSSRDTYRMVLAGAFDIPNLLEDQKSNGELSIVDARNIMHKVSLRMQDPEVLETVARRCNAASSVAMNDSPEAQQIELARKHTVVQEVMVEDVYLHSPEGGSGGKSLVEECGFG
eukprot:CAMPEP_0183723220 /NCGR_PEP_ID=MMETSP0737-20130205/14880_1 /TAXON_ID=385413 /ORGANISM="Thalassiosira miniscula, Strain CCMP1093" /LENGTH=312 /DNA_ID=CAMNT_0025953477 /DNA_START=116 /DNA_END=1051 /DNA_ORIENTATION=-